MFERNKLVMQINDGWYRNSRWVDGGIPGGEGFLLAGQAVVIRPAGRACMAQAHGALPIIQIQLGSIASQDGRHRPLGVPLLESLDTSSVCLSTTSRSHTAAYLGNAAQSSGAPPPV